MNEEQNNTKTSSGSAVQVSTRDEWVLLQKQCKAFITSGFLPDHITKGCSPDQAMAKALTIAIKGRELGIPPLHAFSSITVLRGKPCLSAELMLALVYQRVKGAKVTFKTPPEKQASECVVEMQRPQGDPMLFRFSMDDAKAAGLVRNDSAWQKFPAAMLRARAVSAGARAVFPDAIMGCYTPEEMGGDIIDAEPEAPLPRQSAPVAPEKKLPVKNAESSPPPAKTVNTQADYSDKNPSPRDCEPCTEPQQKRLWAICKEKGVERDEVLEELFAEADNVWGEDGKPHATRLTKAQMQHAFKHLESMPNVGH